MSWCAIGGCYILVMYFHATEFNTASLVRIRQRSEQICLNIVAAKLDNARESGLKLTAWCEKDEMQIL